MYKPLLSSLSVLLFAHALYGQSQVAPDSRIMPGASPTGSGLENLYSPNLYDGSTNINIPIYSYEAGGANYGISFGYNTKGVKVNEVASQIGLHWTLNAGGSITRVVKDLPDEIQIQGSATTMVGTNEYTSPYVKFKGRYVTYFESTADAAATNTYRDQESDDFIVSVGGLTFTFNLASGTVIYTNPKRNVKVQVLLDGAPVTSVSNTQMIGTSSTSLIMEFVVTDEEGNQYFFKRGDHFMGTIMDEFNDANGRMADYYYTGKWDVSKILLASGREINYAYSPMYISMADYKHYEIRENLDGTSGTLGGSEVKRSGTYSRLDSIMYPNDVRALFVYGTEKRCDYRSELYETTQAAALREIKISSKSNCLRYALQQAYFLTPAPGQSLEETPYGTCITYTTNPGYISENARYHRLKLKGITIKSCDGTVEEPYYTFGYESQYLPKRLSGSQDFFGYYNGKESILFDKDATIPSHIKFGSSSGITTYTDKTPDATYAKASLLNKVSNAYGGSLTFSYGAHTGLTATLPHDSLLTNNLYLGRGAGDGVRLNSITEQDTYHPDNNKMTDFSYTEGQIFTDGGFFHYPTRISDGTNIIRSLNMTGQYMSSHHLVNGSNHGYGNVTVRVRKNGTELLSRRIITFTNFKDATSSNVARYQKSGKHYYEFPYTDKQYLRDWEMGLPLTITEYDENNRIIQQTSNTYNFTTESYTSLVNTKKGFMRSWETVYPAGSGLFQKRIFTDTYSPYRGKALLANTVTLKYVSDSRNIADTSWYSYDSRDQVKSIITRNSKGDKVHTIHYYNYDAGTTTMPGLEKIVSTQRWLQPAGTTTAPPAAGFLLDAFFNSYKYEAVGTTGSRKVWNERLYALMAGEPLSNAVYQGTGSYVTTAQKINGAFAGATLPNFKEASRVLLYDAAGNPLETKLLAQEQYKAMLWDTITGNKLAEAANCRYSDIAYTSFENTLSAAASGGSLTMASGNISFTISKAGTPSGIGKASGKNVYTLNATDLAAQAIFGTNTLTAGREYLLSFWSRGAAARPYIGTTLLTPTLLYTIGSWNYYQVRFTPATAAAFKISGPTSGTAYVDEVRLYPSDATMQSQTYEPLFGISSSTDATGRITYYEYDKLGRQTIIRDQENNILSKTQHTVQGPQ